MSQTERNVKSSQRMAKSDRVMMGILRESYDKSGLETMGKRQEKFDLGGLLFVVAVSL